ncbi:asparagine synthase [Microbacterium sp. 1.5R]|uniref:asparagine synthase n=1 Tax=Microbacterium TaxID=33882 RepID=UPI00090A1FFE|nr:MULTISPECIES: asparagine synthase [unclassified Microbacterium]APH44071.1 asparagine synthase [Microbacterium sp. 1.5R]MDY0985239.1 asparagine synthase [Microbacterium sp. CFBP9023]
MGRTADAIAEGVAIATAAARLAVKNHILIGTIAENGVFDTDKYVADAREALRAMAEESEEVERNLTELRKRARGRHSDPSGTHDYRDRDVRNLRRRAKQSHGVATKLRDMMEDEAALRVIVEEAREGAWADVRHNLDRRLRVEGMRPDQDPDYDRMREARMQALRLVDLQALSSLQRAKAKRKNKQNTPDSDE